MKPRRILVFTIILLITLQNLHGQGNTAGKTDNLTNSELCLTGDLFTPDLIIDPATYFNSYWLSGDIYLTNGEIIRNKLIKYNGLMDELFWQEPESKNIIKLDKEAIHQFHFQIFNGDTTVYFRKIRIKRNIISDSSDYFAEVVYDGTISLFILHTFKTNGTEIINKNGKQVEKPVYNEEPIYIFRSGKNKTFITRSLNRKSLYAFSPGDKEKIKEFLKTNNTVKSINNLYMVRLTQFLGTLLN